jgi:hypothetical protein
MCVTLRLIYSTHPTSIDLWQGAEAFERSEGSTVVGYVVKWFGADDALYCAQHETEADAIAAADKVVRGERRFTDGRSEQSFRDQEHLDAFYRYFDHINSCRECRAPGPAFPLDDGLQGSMLQCDRGLELFAASY